jgi:ABC-type uncharacterized transport system permease subunit
MKRKRSFSVSRHQQQTQIRLILVGLLILVVVGGGLVWVIYGRAAAITAMTCLLVVAGFLGLLWLILSLLERWVKEDEP